MTTTTKRTVAAIVVAIVAVVFLRSQSTTPARVDAGSAKGQVARAGHMILKFDALAIDGLGWQLNANGSDEEIDLSQGKVSFPIQPSSTLRVESTRDGRAHRTSGRIETLGGILLTGAGDRWVLGNLAIEYGQDGIWSVINQVGASRHRLKLFELSSVLTDYSARENDLQIIGELSITNEWAKRLGQPEAAGIIVGVVRIQAKMVSAADGQRLDDVAARSRRDASEPTTDEGGTAGVIGPDVIVADLQSVKRYGRVGDITAYAVGTNACNIGDERADWVLHTNQHPVIVMNMYRLRDNQFEQIGMSWVKHGFYAVSSSLCQPCNDPTDGTQLGVGCSDPYSADLNAAQDNMSLRSKVNAHTGYFPYDPPFANWNEAIDKRLQVHDADLDPDLNVDAKYFVQGHYVTPGDAAAGNSNNNASYRAVSVVEIAANNYVVLPSLGLTTQREQPAIKAWQDEDATVYEIEAQVPGEGLFIVSVRTTDLGTGFFHYDYAIQNLNSDRSADSLSIPLPRAAIVNNIGFHDVDYHSGEGYDLTDWPAVVENGTITWSTDAYADNENANALRFSTLYNFRFDCNVSPGTTVAMLGLFKPGFPEELQIRTYGPSLDMIDCNNNGIEDSCDVSCTGCESPCGASVDCDGNGVPDECEPDCNENGVVDRCDIDSGSSTDCNSNTVPDECEPDCDGDGIPDDCDTFEDTDQDGIFDCWDQCPLTTPPGSCICPALGRCCWDSGICIDNYPRLDCITTGGTPDCLESPCRDGCLIGDGDADGDRDLSDCAGFASCFSGHFQDPGFVTPSTLCLENFDFDGDADVDLADYAQMQALLNGP